MNELLIYPGNTHQTFSHFGISGAWWAQEVGGWDETDEKSGIPKNERIAELLFSDEKGIGIGSYRYNLGAGSAISGRGNIEEKNRRAESFDVSEFEYNWSRDANAVKMMALAVKNGVDEITFFVNSPPERYTKNGKAHCDRPFTTNLDKSNYTRFVKYCLDCAEHFIDWGFPVKYLSPVNEPVWKWTGGQEGCHYTPTQVWNLFRIFADEMDRRPKLKNLKLAGAENGDIRWFNKTYTRLLLGDVKVAPKLDTIDVHSYFITPNYAILKSTVGDRPAYLRRFRKYMDKHYPDKPVKVSEWCHMKSGRDYSMKSALAQARVMTEDLKLLDAASWEGWIALSNVDYCDGLIYYFNDIRSYRMTKRYYAFGNFSKFIKPGSVRIETYAGEGLESVAFKKDGKIITVITNRKKEEVPLLLPRDDGEIYLTDSKHDLEKVEFTKEFTVPKRSVVTLIMDE